MPGCGMGQWGLGVLSEPGEEKGPAGGTGEGQRRPRASRKALGQESVDSQAARASCRLDRAQVLMGTSPASPGRSRGRVWGQTDGVWDGEQAASGLMTEREGDCPWQGGVSPGPGGPAGAGAPLPLPSPPRPTQKGRRPPKRGRLQARHCGLCLARTETRSHPVPTVKAGAASQGHGVPARSACRVLPDSRRRPVPFHRGGGPSKPEHPVLRWSAGASKPIRSTGPGGAGRLHVSLVKGQAVHRSG